jgi:hypothetical protein
MERSGNARTQVAELRGVKVMPVYRIGIGR